MFERLRKYLETIRVSSLLNPEHNSTSTDEAKTAVAPEVMREIKASQIDLLYQMDSKGGFKPIFVFFIATLFAPAETRVFAIGTFVLYLVTSQLYQRLVTAYFASETKRSDPHKWAFYYAVASLLTGAVWGIGTITWYDFSSVESQALVSMIMLGIAAATVVSRALHMPSMIGFLIFSATPIFFMLILTASAFTITAAILGFFLVFALVQWGDALNKSQIDSIALRYMMGSLRQSHALADEARDAAVAGSRAKSEFLAMMSHEVRTPLNGILGMAQVLQFSSIAGPQREHVDAIVESGNSLLSILNDILDISKMEAGRLEIQHFEFDATPEVIKSANLFRPTAQEKSVEIAVIVDTANPLVVVGDPHRLRQILNNLIGNAVKFTETGTITITAAKPSSDLHKSSFYPQHREGDVLFTITDTGLGIAEDLQPALFNPFTQADQSSTRKYGGTGLGLSICRRLVTLMDGSIGFESTPDKGSTFWFGLSSQHNAADIPDQPLRNTG